MSLRSVFKLGGCGAAIFAAGVPMVGIGYAGVALAFGLTVVTGAYALGHISGAVSFMGRVINYPTCRRRRRRSSASSTSIRPE